MMSMLVWAVAFQAALGAVPTAQEVAESQAWAAAKFEGVAPGPVATGKLVVHANNDPVQRNERNGRLMRIVGTEYQRGLYCHAVSNVEVVLPAPGATFSAVIGVDTNENTSGGRGSVEFVVKVDGREAYHSALLREGAAGIPISVALGGATRFTLEVTDGGDGIGCDQADWAEAKVTCQDGAEYLLGDMPIEGQQRGPWTLEPFFSFEYDGNPSSGFLKDWPVERSAKALDDHRTAHTLIWNDPATMLEVRCEAVEYKDFPTVEWTLYFKNAGSSDSPILSDIQAVDTVFKRDADGEFTLYSHSGDNCTADSYEPHTETLGPKENKRIANTGGRPTQTAFPYFNIAAPNEGVIAVLSWAGQWAAMFSRDEGNRLRLRGGQELTHFTLHPGEEVRSPLVVLHFWKGDRLHAQNVWRSWMIAHNIPKRGDATVRPPLMEACSSHWYGEMINANSDTQKMFIDDYFKHGMKLDYWWMDAGWYWNKTGWPNTGTWEVDTNRFPGGLRPISDYAHAKDVDIVVWFEPERVTAGTWLTENHPEWILGGEDGGLLNLGDPEAREWLTNHVDGLIASEGIDLYRQDFNMDPLPYWRKNDTEDRQGITEIRHVEGYLAYWDELQRRHPGMLIDSCASGGRRNDLETLRRAVPLLRSDYIMEPLGNQCHTWSLAFWFPFFGTGSSKTDSYDVQSILCPSLNACWDQRNETIDWPELKRLVDDWKAYAPLYYGDYYPVTAYSLAPDQWIGWQFHDPEKDAGMVQIFRRSESPFISGEFPLKGLSEDGTYSVKMLRTGGETDYSSATLRDSGVPVSIAKRPGFEVAVYRRVK